MNTVPIKRESPRLPQAATSSPRWPLWNVSGLCCRSCLTRNDFKGKDGDCALWYHWELLLRYGPKSSKGIMSICVTKEFQWYDVLSTKVFIRYKPILYRTSLAKRHTTAMFAMWMLVIPSDKLYTVPAFGALVSNVSTYLVITTMPRSLWPGPGGGSTPSHYCIRMCTDMFYRAIVVIYVCSSTPMLCRSSRFDWDWDVCTGVLQGPQCRRAGPSRGQCNAADAYQWTPSCQCEDKREAVLCWLCH